MIRHIKREDIEICVQVIRKSFETIAQEFSLSKDNCPGHTSFIQIEKLYKQYDEGRLMFSYIHKDSIVGYFSLVANNDGSYELDNLAVLREFRHKGFGREMVSFAIDKVRELGSNKITIGIIEENTRLKNWYSSIGFIHTGIRKYRNLPFEVGFMEIKL